MVARPQRRKLMTRREAQIIKRLRVVIKLPVTQIAIAAGQHKKSIYQVLNNKLKFASRGPKEKLTKADVDRTVKIQKVMVAKAKARFEIILALLKRRAKLNVCDKVLRKASHARNIKFKVMRSKPVLTKADRMARYAFACKYRGKSKAWWLKHVHVHWDLKILQKIKRFSRKYKSYQL